jgi:proteasome lid subunit RPN8/RPN11
MDLSARNAERNAHKGAEMTPELDSVHLEDGMTRIRIEPQPWEVITGSARMAYPEECCGVMLGITNENGKVVHLAQPLENATAAARRSRYELNNSDLLSAQRKARTLGMSLIGIYHSHPDRGAGFSVSDLEASCPWLSYLILSVRGGEVEDSACWVSNFEQTEARREELEFAANSDLPVA